MSNDQPSGIGFDGRSTVAKLQRFPGLLGDLDRDEACPAANVIAEAHPVSVSIPPRQGHVLPAYFARKNRKSFTGSGGTSHLAHPKTTEIRRLQKMLRHERPVKGGVRSQVGHRSIVVGEPDETSVFHAVPFGFGLWPQDPLRQLSCCFEFNRVRRVGNPIEVRNRVGSSQSSGSVDGQLVETGPKLVVVENWGERIKHEAGVFSVVADFGKLVMKQIAIVTAADPFTGNGKGAGHVELNLSI